MHGGGIVALGWVALHQLRGSAGVVDAGVAGRRAGKDGRLYFAGDGAVVNVFNGKTFSPMPLASVPAFAAVYALLAARRWDVVDWNDARVGAAAKREGAAVDDGRWIGGQLGIVPGAMQRRG